jgi:hypothetical protein
MGVEIKAPNPAFSQAYSGDLISRIQAHSGLKKSFALIVGRSEPRTHRGISPSRKQNAEPANWY